jgi:ribonuclease III
MRADSDFAALEAVLEHDFRNREILVRALTHKSRRSELEKPEAGPLVHNEQLEFLGDAVLGFLVSESLVATHPEYSEGRLSKLKAHLVSATHLYDVAAKLELGNYLILGRTEEVSGGRTKKGLLANAVEAIIAALFLDGGLEASRRFVVRHIFGGFDAAAAAQKVPVTDFKSTLQEMALSLRLPEPRYVIVGEQGPPHQRTFTVEARVGKRWTAQAEGTSKKSASQKAAEQVVNQLIENGSESAE